MASFVRSLKRTVSSISLHFNSPTDLISFSSRYRQENPPRTTLTSLVLGPRQFRKMPCFRSLNNFSCQVLLSNLHMSAATFLSKQGLELRASLLPPRIVVECKEIGNDPDLSTAALLKRPFPKEEPKLSSAYGGAKKLSSTLGSLSISTGVSGGVMVALSVYCRLYPHGLSDTYLGHIRATGGFDQAQCVR